MSPPLIRVEADRRINAIIDFAQELSHRCKASLVDPTVVPDIRKWLHSLPQHLPSKRLTEFDAVGTDLWNLSTRLQRDKEKPTEALCLLRVFACYMLDSASQNIPPTLWSNTVRVLRVILRTAQMCINQNEISLSVKILERGAYYSNNMNSGVTTSNEDTLKWYKLKNDFLILRLLLAYKQSNMQVAEHMYSQIEVGTASPNSVSAEVLADTLHEIGQDAYKKKNYDVAVLWLRRAVDVLTGQESDALTPSASDLKVCTMHWYTKSLLAINTPESLSQARNSLGLMEVEGGDRVYVCLLRLELLAVEPCPDVTIIQDVFLRLFHNVHLTKPIFKLILHHLHILRMINPETASKCLDDFFLIRLFSAGNMEFIERACCMRILITVTNDPNLATIASLEAFLNTVRERISGPFATLGATAAVTVIWKQVQIYTSQGPSDMSESLCSLACHDLFRNCGEFNKGKIARRLIQCSIRKRDWSFARQRFFAMPEAIQAMPKSQYLLFQVAIGSEDEKLAINCLDQIVCAPTKNDDLLCASIFAAQNAGNKRLAIQALQKTLEKYKYNSPDEVHLPSVIRAIVKLMKSELRKQPAKEWRDIDGFCQLFEAGAAHASKSPTITRPSKDFTKNEWEWLGRNSYLFVSDNATDLHPKYVTRLANSCVQFIEVLMCEAINEELPGLRLRRIHCEFLSMTANLIMARSTDEIQVSSQHYTVVLKHAQQVRDHVVVQLGLSPKDEFATDLRRKHFDATLYELEAVIKLKKWEELESIFAECWRYPHESKKWKTLANLAFLLDEELLKAGAGTAQRERVFKFIQHLIKHSDEQTQKPTKKAHWLRCLFQIAYASNSAIGLQCIEQATSIATIHRHTTNAFPIVELEWLAATAFNHAVDFYSAGDDENCKLWAEKAINLAAQGEDWSLMQELEKRYSGLTWQSGDDDMRVDE